MAALLHEHAPVIHELARQLEALYSESDEAERDGLDLYMRELDALVADPDRDEDQVKGALVLYVFRMIVREVLP